MKTTNIITLFLISIFFFSCSSSTDGLDVTNSTDINTIKELMVDKFDNMEVNQVIISTEDELSNNFGSLNVAYIKDGKLKNKLYNQLVPGDNKMQPARDGLQIFLEDKQGKIKLSDFDFDMVASKFKEASKLIDGNYENHALYNFTFHVKNDNSVTARFQINATEKGENPETNGDIEITNYYEFDFEMDANGTLTLTN